MPRTWYKLDLFEACFGRIINFAYYRLLRQLRAIRYSPPASTLFAVVRERGEQVFDGAFLSCSQL